MKAAIPENAKIAKDAKECLQECVSELISFITSEAAEKCFMEKRKTIGGEDILYAMTSLGFDDYEATLKIYLAKLRQVSICAISLRLLTPFSTRPPLPRGSMRRTRTTNPTTTTNNTILFKTFNLSICRCRNQCCFDKMNHVPLIAM